LRIKGGKDIEFVVLKSAPESFHLYPFTKKGKDRQAPIEIVKPAIGPFGRASKQEVPPMEVDISKYGELSYRLLVRALGPGEYGFATEFNVFDSE
jgi:hypothetical protein